MEEIIDVHSKGTYPSKELSNFYPHQFEMDGVKCGSMEGFLQSLKFRSPKKQKTVCALSGKEAKKKGKWKFFWKLTGNVYWQGQKYKRTGEDFQSLILRAYRELYAQNAEFRKALNDVGNKKLIHSIGKHNPKTTVLTEEEFIFCLNQVKK